MNIIVANSRGSNLAPIAASWPNTQMRAMSGADLNRMANAALSMMAANKTRQPHHVYFIDSINDLTQKESDQYYQEVIFMESPSEAIARIKTKHTTITNSIINAGGIPCFSTITPVSLQDWNHSRLYEINVRTNRPKTSHLLHFHHYDDMQELLKDAIVEINKDIIASNNNLDMFTPKLAEEILYKAGKKRKTHRAMFNRLDDGIHPSKDTILAWSQTLQQAIITNRKRHPISSSIEFQQ